MIQIALLIVLTLALPAGVQAVNPELLTSRWQAQWIAPTGAPPFDCGVYHFRRVFDLPERPSAFTVHVTADNRYQLYVNGSRVAWGPSRGDLYHWRYETVDIAGHLRRGRNVLAAVVWNDGPYAAVAQITSRTGFLLQGDTEREGIVNTGREWRSTADKAYGPLPISFQQVNGYVAIPPGERVDASRYPWGWESPEFDDSSWKPSQALSPGSSRDSSDAPNRWMLTPRPIPPMEESPQRFARVRRAENIKPPAEFPAKAAPFEVPAGTTAVLLIDQDHETTGFPELLVSGGRGAAVSLRYAEALWNPDRKDKGNRSEIDGKVLLGYQDVFLPDGGRRTFRPLHWRTWRYLELKVETKDQPLAIEDLRSTYTGYPFVRKARFDAGSDELRRMLDTGWRTARLCAHETYMDCPYYEQLQYVGDTRIQALVSLYMTGDMRLARNAIELLNASRTGEGATYSRAPSALQQYIPPFSLWWIGMVRDYWWYVDDPDFVRRMLPGVRSVLSFYAGYQKPGGSLGRMPWWNFVDWVEKWANGVPPMEADGSAAPIDLQLLLAYQWAANLEDAVGLKEMAAVYRGEAKKLRARIPELYWDQRRGLFADTPRRTEFSQHSNSLAVLAGLVTDDEARRVMERVATDPSLTAATVYYRYYLHQAMRLAGLGDRYLDMLQPWRKMLSQGLTTWAETDNYGSRSDCHAWSASPNIELFRTVLGIDSAAPGFRRVVIEPHPGALTKLSGATPHARGELTVGLDVRQDKLSADVILPAGVEGDFYWRGQRRALASGKNRLELR